MEVQDIAKLETFLGPNIANMGCSLYLPKFRGSVELKQEPYASSTLQYGGETFSERDTKAAFYVTSMLGQVVDSDKIKLEKASRFVPVTPRVNTTAFVFGSRSNQVTLWATENLPVRKFFTFKFGEKWEIICEDGQTFSMTDPSTLSHDSYETQTDYGVVSRISDPLSGERVFVIAGLGSRATEGCGYYFAHHWKELFQKYGENDFALILKFTPPLDPLHCEPVAWFGDEVLQSVYA